MNCPEVAHLLQLRLDGDQGSRSDQTLDEHLFSCRACRELFAAGHRLLEGLERSSAMSPPANLSEQITRRVLIDRARARRGRHIVAGLALAAAGILALVYYSPALRESPANVSLPEPIPAENQAKAGALPIRESVEQAGEAFYSLARRTADETLGQSRYLVPPLLPEQRLPESEQIVSALKQPADSLEGLRTGVTGAFEPVAASARRAFHLFLKEVPSVQRPRPAG